MTLPNGSYGDYHLKDTFGKYCKVGDRIAWATSAGIRIGRLSKITVVWYQPQYIVGNTPNVYSPWDVVHFTLERENGGVKKNLTYAYHPDYLVRFEKVNP